MLDKGEEGVRVGRRGVTDVKVGGGRRGKDRGRK